MSNHTDALVLKEEDRRINVFRGPDKVQPRDYYNDLYGWLEKPDCVAGLYHELMARDLSGFNWQTSMKNEARAEMIGNTRSSTETLFVDFIADPPHKAMSMSHIKSTLNTMALGEGIMVDAKQVTKLLQHHCKQSPRITIGGREGKSVRPWILDPQIKNDAAAIRQAVIDAEKSSVPWMNPPDLRCFPGK